MRVGLVDVTSTVRFKTIKAIVRGPFWSYIG